MSGQVVSLGERLRLKREELGLSQSQAARELDVARTAYRLWEMEAAKPAPDRWRLISRWLGVSVATMLLAEELIDESEASEAAAIGERFGGSGPSWDDLGEGREGDFFSQERATIAEQTMQGTLSSADSRHLSDTLARVEQASLTRVARGWAPAELRKLIPSTSEAPALARAAFLVTAAGLPAEILGDAEVLTSELVMNSVEHGEGDAILLAISVSDDRLRVEVADEGSGRIRPRTVDATGGWGLTLVTELADRWGAGRDKRRNVTWFEFDLPAR